MGTRYVASQDLSAFDVDLWSERDRSQLTLYRNGEEIFTFWDSDVHSLVEDGFINPNHLLESCVWYANHLGML